MAKETILLTGATGFVGRYLLRELLHHSNWEIVVFVRAENERHAQQRMETVFDWLKIDCKCRQRVEVCCADLTNKYFGKSEAVLNALQRCSTVLHAAANVSFFHEDHDEPARTNVFGTKQLLQQVGPQLKHWVQISTAYVAPEVDGVGVEQEAKQSDFRNEYEATKAAAEKKVTAAALSQGFSLCIARPGIVVGEHGSGRTSVFQGFYQPLRAVARLVNRARKNAAGKVHVPLRINVSPAGVRNLVPVDWVARALGTFVEQGSKASGIFHLTPDLPTTSLDVFGAAQARWQIDRMAFEPELPKQEMTTIERAFYRQLRHIAPYWKGEPRFDASRRQFALPRLPCPIIDTEVVDRLLGYAIDTNWGETSEECLNASHFPADDYLERFLPKHAPLSTLPRLTNVTAEVGFRVLDISAGEWRCRLERGDVVSVRRANCDDVAVVFESDGDTLGAIVGGQLTPQQAFFDRRIEIAGNVEMGLKLAMIFGQFITEFPYIPVVKRGQHHVSVA